MFQFTCCILVLLTSFLQGGDRYRVALEPLDFSGEGAVYLTGIHQIESNGREIYLRSRQEHEIVVISPEGHLIRKIGGKGGHPSEFGYGVLAMAVRGDEVWAIDSGRQRARWFVDGDYVTSFRLKSFNRYFAHQTSNVFAFSDREVVIPADPRTGHLATVHMLDGTYLKDVGALLPFTKELRDRVPGINDSLWLHQNNEWLSIHKFFPLVTRYDRQFKMVGQFQVESAIIETLLRKVTAFDPDDTFTAPIPVVTDAKIHGDHLYLMCGGFLHQVNLANGEVVSITAFYGTGPEFGDVTEPQVTLFFFTFLQSGKLVLAHPAMLWDHDLWTVDVPFLVR